MKKIIITLIIVLANIGKFYAQQQPSDNHTYVPNIVPPSPIAYALGNYGNVPVGLFTGTLTFSLPLFTYKTENIEIPINMFHGSNGIKIDEISGNIGLGWNLNFGGVISRMVRDKPDDTSQKLQIPSNAFSPNNTPAFKNFIFNVGNMSPGIDSEADIYSFNFNGVSGKFFYDRDNQIHLVEQKALKIEKSDVGFVIIQSNGDKYYFNDQESTNFKTLGVGQQLPNIYTTAWYLTKIVSLKGDEVYFTYESMYLGYTTSKSQTYTLSLPHEKCEGAPIPITQGSFSSIAESQMNITGKRIKTISSNNPINGNVNFYYLDASASSIDYGAQNTIQNIIFTDKNGYTIESATFNYFSTTNKRNFLNGITFKDPQKSYEFEYETPNLFPVRLSYSRDYWGYYNGKSNNILVPSVSDENLQNYYNGANQESDPTFTKIGMLRKITYPTKGYTELEYEGNTYWGEKTLYPPITNKQWNVLNPTVGIVQQQFTFTAASDHKITITGSCEYYNPQNPDPAGGPSHTPSGVISLISNDDYAKFYSIGEGTGAFYEGLYSNFTSPILKTIYLDVKAGKTYTFNLSAKRSTSSTYTMQYFNSVPTIFNTNLNTGGVRIKSTRDYDSSSLPNYTRYYYGPMNDRNHSSGDKGVNPVFVDSYNSIEICHGDGMLCVTVSRPYIKVASNSLLPLFDTDKNTSTFYRYVTISHGGDNFERGGETKEFIIHRDYAGSNIWGGNILTTPYTNHGWNNGLELSSKILRKNLNGSLEIIQSKENNYVINNTNTFELKNFTHRRNDIINCTSATPYYCTQYDTSNPNHDCYGKTVGYEILTPYTDNLDVSEYRTISYWQYLKSQTTTDYFNGTPSLTHTDYFYNNPLNYQLSKQKVTSPDAMINEVNYSYAHEKGNQLMINKNMTGIPIETTTTQTIDGTTKTLAKTETLYPISQSQADTKTSGLVLPYEVKSTDFFGTNSTELTYDQYDSKGNLLQYTTKDGITTSIIWGYNTTQPIAKITGATYAQVSSLASAIIAASDTDAAAAVNNDETSLLNALDNFRKASALSAYQITTYTYDPLIGVRSITPPSGIREVYLYDTANRLKEIRENNATGKILKEFKYNYKH